MLSPLVRRTLVPLMALGLLLAACTSDETVDGVQPQLGGEVTEPEQGIAEAGEAQLAPGAGVADPADDAAGAPDVDTDGGAVFVDGEFAEIPLPTAAEPFGGAETEDDVTVQSFSVTSSSPNEIIEFMTAELTAIGWTQGQVDSSGDTESGRPDQIAATFIRDDQTLLVTAADIGEDDSQLTLQLSGA